jgi:hypothetical protein
VRHEHRPDIRSYRPADCCQQRELRHIRKRHAEGLSPYKISADLASRGVKLSHVTIRKIVAGRPQVAASPVIAAFGGCY